MLLTILIAGAFARSAIRPPHDTGDYMPDNIPFSEDYDHESFLGHDDKAMFDGLSASEAKARLIRMIPLLDEDRDGMITVDELHDWIKKQLLVFIMEDAANLHEGNDVNHDSFVSWKEYVATTYGLGFVDNEQKAPEDSEFDYREMILRDYNKFITADANGDQFLSVDEMASFIHPEEFHHTRHLAIEESMKDLDRNKDGKISVEEYIADLIADEEDDRVNNPEYLDTERLAFLNHRDKDGDGHVDMEELKEWFQPNGVTPALAEAQHLIALSDSDKDGLLSAQEIVTSYRVFVGSQATNYGKMLHSEL